MSQGPRPPAEEPGRYGSQPPPPSADRPPGPPRPSGPPSGGPPVVGAPADLTTRFLAKFIDWLLLLLVMAVVLVPISFLLAFGGVWSGDDPLGAFSLDQIVSNLLLSGLALAYFALLESSRGQTIGKMLLKLEVVGPAGEPPSRAEALKRNAYILLAIVPVIGSLAYLATLISIAVTIDRDQARRGWHDRFAGGTRVIRTD